jgi:hypothetical protein
MLAQSERDQERKTRTGSCERNAVLSQSRCRLGVSKLPKSTALLYPGVRELCNLRSLLIDPLRFCCLPLGFESSRGSRLFDASDGSPPISCWFFGSTLIAIHAGAQAHLGCLYIRLRTPFFALETAWCVNLSCVPNRSEVRLPTSFRQYPGRTVQQVFRLSQERRDAHHGLQHLRRPPALCSDPTV